MQEQQQVNKARLIGYSIGLALAVVAILWRLVR